MADFAVFEAGIAAGITPRAIWNEGDWMASQVEKILILAKTYPSLSAQHVETSCVADTNEQGAMRRLYPVPFRLIEEGQKFKKWQWIEVRVKKANKDHRAESHLFWPLRWAPIIIVVSDVSAAALEKYR